MTSPSPPDIVARLRAFAVWPSQTSILLHASEAIALLARIDAAEAALLEVREALERLVSVADNAGWSLNSIMMDRAIAEARAALSRTTNEGDS